MLLLAIPIQGMAQSALLRVATFGTGALSNVANPFGGVLVSRDGFLFGSTLGYPEHPAFKGLYRMGADGSDFRILHEFGSVDGDGLPPMEALIQTETGRLYGTTRQGGTDNHGVVFSLEPDGSDYRILRRFEGALFGDGVDPRMGLIEGSDGFLYGATAGGGDRTDTRNPSAGTVYRIAKDGTGYEILHHFHVREPAGIGPTGVIEGRDGLLYGVCDSLGAGFGGTIWRLRKDGSGLEVLHVFQNKGDEGNFPNARLLQARNGWLYGTTIQNQGVSSKSGVLYRIQPDGSGFEILRRPTVAEGEYLWWELVQAGDGKLYGTAERGGTRGLGSVYRLNPDGTGFEVVHSFAATEGDGAFPGGKLTLGPDDTLLGVTVFGGSKPGGFGDGTVFRMETGVPVTLEFRLLLENAWRVDGTGTPGGHYRIQTSGILTGGWVTVAEPVADAGGHFGMSGPPLTGERFFVRAIPF